MSGDGYTLKEVVENYMQEMKKSISELHEKIDKINETTTDTKIQATKTNGRVNKLDEAVETMTAIIKSHDEVLIENTATAETNKANNSRNWKLFFFISPFLISFIGWVGYLYIEHLKKEIISVSIEELRNTLENYQVEAIIKQ